MKPFNIDLETIKGAALLGAMVEIQGAMTVTPEGNPLEGVRESSLHMSLATAKELHRRLGQVLAATQPPAG